MSNSRDIWKLYMMFLTLQTVSLSQGKMDMRSMTSQDTFSSCLAISATSNRTWTCVPQPIRVTLSPVKKRGLFNVYICLPVITQRTWLFYCLFYDLMYSYYWTCLIKVKAECVLMSYLAVRLQLFLEVKCTSLSAPALLQYGTKLWVPGRCRGPSLECRTAKGL